MVLRTTGPPDFQPKIGERIRIIEEGHRPWVGTTTPWRGAEGVVDTYSTYEPPHQRVIAKFPGYDRKYVSAFVPGTVIEWLDRDEGKPAQDFNLKVGDTFTMVKRTNVQTISGITYACVGHAYVVSATTSPVRSQYGVPVCKAECRDCTERKKKTVYETDLIKDVKSKDTTALLTETPKDLEALLTETEAMFTLHVVQVKAGHVGQVHYDGGIVWESEPQVDDENLTRDEDGDVQGDGKVGYSKAYDLAQEAKKKAVEAMFKDV
jgi:hypothetical protein